MTGDVAVRGHLRRRTRKRSPISRQKEWYVRFENQMWGYVYGATKAKAKANARKLWPKEGRIEHIERKFSPESALSAGIRHDR